MGLGLGGLGKLPPFEQERLLGWARAELHREEGPVRALDRLTRALSKVRR